MARGYMYAPGASAEVDSARREVLDKTQLVVLGQSKNEVVREIIAARTDCPLGIMVTLTHDRSTDVRAAVAGNPSVSRTVMEHLAEDKQVAVLEALVRNPALPGDMLDQLAFHRRSEVRDLVAERLDSGIPTASSAQDAATPELRDRVFDEQARAREADVLDIATGRHVTEQRRQPDEGAPRAPRTRTAPVRGFKPPEAI